MAKSKYESLIATNLDVISGMAKKGMAEEDIAKHFKIAYSTFRKYKKAHKELHEALKHGVENANAIIAGKLFESSTGFYRTVQKPIKVKHTEFDAEKGRKLKEWEEIAYVDETIYYPPNVGAIALWLTNKDSNEFSKNPKTEITQDGGGVVLLPDVKED